MGREGKAPATIVNSEWFRDLLDRDLGHRPVREITPHDLLSTLKKIEGRGHHESAQRARAFAGRVFLYAVVTLRADTNPADVLRGALTSPSVKHHAAIIDPVALCGLMRINSFQLKFAGRRNFAVLQNHRLFITISQ